MEKWLRINSFPKYEVSDEGHIRNSNTGRILKPGYNPKGYQIVSLYENGESSTKKIHRLVAEAFCDRNENDVEVNHIDGNKNHNSASNLEWCTGSHNIQHAYDSGLKTPPRIKRVRVVETGEVFNSMSDCARAIGGTVSGIYDCETGRQSTHRGYHFEWIQGDAK